MTSTTEEKTGSFQKKSLWQILGPGILYAAAAVGVSHLVQATRAGGSYGLGLALVIIAACIVKYPTMRFGADFSAATGKSLIAGYRAQGKLAFGAYAIAQAISVVFVAAAVGLLTLGVLQITFGFKVNSVLGVGLLLGCSAILLLTGGYSLLERATKLMVALLSILVLVATLMVAPQVDWSFSGFALPSFSISTTLFIIALIGFMPTPSEGAVFHSVWTCARAEAEGKLPPMKESILDFNVGYVGSVFLALCFMVLGAGLFYGADVEMAGSAADFADQLISVFTQTFGDWAFPIISLTALFVIFSTLITGLDAMTRAFVTVVDEINPEHHFEVKKKRLFYKLAMAGICIGATIVLATLLTSFTAFIDIVTILSFTISPIMAYLNHRAVTHELMPEDAQPSRALRIWSILSIILLAIATVAFFYIRLRVM